MTMTVLANLVLALAFDGAAGEVLAQPKYRMPPDYPSACMAAPGAPTPDERVIVAYVITDDGVPEGARVRETTNACFNEAAIAAVRSWRFEPRRVDGKARPQEDVETTLVFKVSEPTVVSDFDARPLVRVPPRYPHHCMDRAAARETVLVEFDVTTEGKTSDPRVLDASMDCLKTAALEAVLKWKYSPATVDGVPQIRRSVQTLIAFELSGAGVGYGPEQQMRPQLYRRLSTVRSNVLRGKDAAQALAELQAIEEKYGVSFTKLEQASFHQTRAAARITAKDYRGALDDLRTVVRVGSFGDNLEPVREMIAKLEKVVAAQDTADAKAASEPQGQPESQPESEPQSEPAQ
jgi:TonB family protein